MTPDRAFLQAILEQPEDDAPRLLYADWLTERGDERGEFIRAQCELAHTAIEPRHRQYWEVVEYDLLSRNRNTWLGPLRSLGYRWEFRRGFPEEVVIDAATFLDHSALFCSSVPLCVVRLVRSRSLIRELVSCPAIDRLTGLHLTENALWDREVECLVASRYLRHLETLRLGMNRLGDAAAYALAESPNLERLTTLDLSGNYIGDAGADYLASTPNLPRLTALYLKHNAIGPLGCKWLRTSTFLGSLETLELEHNGERRPAPASVPTTASAGS